MKNKKIISIILLVVVLIISVVVIYTRKPDSPAYKLMDDILSGAGMNDYSIVSNSIGWSVGRYMTIDGKIMKIYRPGFTFTKEYSPSEYIQIVKANGATSTINHIFASELESRGFKLDLNNIADGTSNGSVGYSMDKIGCIISDQLVIENEGDIGDENVDPLRITISCIDDISIKNSNLSSSTTVSTTNNI